MVNNKIANKIVMIMIKTIRTNCNELSRIKKIKLRISRLDRLVGESV